MTIQITHKHVPTQSKFPSSPILSFAVVIVSMALMLSAATVGSVQAEEQFRPWFDPGLGFSVTPRGVAGAFSSDGNWLVYANSNPLNSTEYPNRSVRIDVIDSSDPDSANWERVRTFALETPSGGMNFGYSTDVAFHPSTLPLLSPTPTTAKQTALPLSTRVIRIPFNWSQVQVGDIELYPTPGASTLRFSDDGAFLAVGTEFDQLEDEFNLGWEVFDTSDPDPSVWETVQVVPVISGDEQLEGEATDSAFSPDGNRLIFVDQRFDSNANGQYVKVIDSSGENWFALFTQPTVDGRANGVDFHPSGQWFAVGHRNGNGITLFETDTLEKVSDFDVDIGGNGLRLRFSPDGNAMAVGYLASVGNEGVRWIDTSAPDPADWVLDNSIGPTNVPSSARDIAFSSDGEYVAMAHRDDPFATVGQRVKAPSSPRNVSASYVAGSFDSAQNQGEITVSWDAPSYDGGIGVDRYELSSIDNAFETIVVGSATNTATATFDYTQLADTSLVPVELVAVGEAELESPTAQAVAGLPSVPGTVSGLAPTDVSVDDDVASWQFAWTVPQDDGGAPVLGYRVIAEYPDGAPALSEVNDSFIEVDFGLNGGDISVAAVNEFGEGDSITTAVPDLTPPVLSAEPVFSAVSSGSGSVFEVNVKTDQVESWGLVGGNDAPPGEYVFTYQGASGPIEAVATGGSGAASSKCP